MKIKAKPIKTTKPRRPTPKVEALHKSFNIFTEYGENIVVKSAKPMTLAEAQYHYKALSISAND